MKLTRIKKTKEEYTACDLCKKEIDNGALRIVDHDDTDDNGVPVGYEFHSECIMPVIKKAVDK